MANHFSRSIFFTALLLTITSSARAQYTWQTVFDQSDDTTQHYSPYLLACNGNHCTAIVYAGRESGINIENVYEFLRSDDGGLTWHNLWEYPGYSVPPGYQFVFAMQQIDSLNVVAVGDSGHIFRTFDGGVTWSLQTSPPPYSIGSIRGVHFHDPMNGIIGFGDRCGTTSDGGLHWTLGPYSGLGSGNCHCYGAGKFAVFNSMTGVLYRTSNNWAAMDSTSPVPNASNLYLQLWWSDWTEGDTIIGYGHDSASSGLIVRTSNAGRTWSQSELPQGQTVDCMSAISDDTLFAGRSVTMPNSILFSSDNGQSWVSDSVPTFTNGGLNGPFFQFTAVNSIVRPAPGVVLAVVQEPPLAFGPGLIIRGTLASADVSVPAPNTIGIAQVWPNPSGESITVNFDYRLAPVRVTDALGRERMRVQMPEDGPLLLDISKLPNGIYFLIDDRERAKFVKE